MAFNDFPLGTLRKNQKYQRIHYWLLKMFVTNRDKTFKRRLNILKSRTIYVYMYLVNNSEKCIFENYICD